jgi:hypothetical protein
MSYNMPLKFLQVKRAALPDEDPQSKLNDEQVGELHE